MTPQLEEFALRLEVGARAIREGRVNATVAELVTGALESTRAEALAWREPEPARMEAPRLEEPAPQRRHKSAAEKAATRRGTERLDKREAKGLCPRCGRTPIVPGSDWCAMCLLRERVMEARRRGEIPHIRHPKPEEKAS